MFTGIIETTAQVINIKYVQSNMELYLSASLVDQLRIDQSLSHNGVCLTVDQKEDDWYRCTLIKETLDHTNFRSIQKGEKVNLERSIKPDSRMDGHFVQGHVDTIVQCTQIMDMDGSWIFTFNLPDQFKSLMVHKGSVCINGVSLTVSALSENTFSVSIIPYTFHHTNFGWLKEGNEVNIEFDILGKYIKRMIDLRDQGLLL